MAGLLPGVGVCRDTGRDIPAKGHASVEGTRVLCIFPYSVPIARREAEVIVGGNRAVTVDAVCAVLINTHGEYLEAGPGV